MFLHGYLSPSVGCHRGLQVEAMGSLEAGSCSCEALISHLGLRRVVWEPCRILITLELRSCNGL